MTNGLDIVAAIAAAAPYMLPMLYLVWRQQQRIDLLEGRQQRMVDWFMEHSDMDAQQAEIIRSGKGT